MTDAESVSELPEQATALVDVPVAAGDERRKRRKERKQKRAEGAGADEAPAEGNGDEGGTEGRGSGVVVDVEPKVLSVKQRRKRLAKNRIKRRKARLAKQRKREAAREEEERRRAEQIAYEQRRMQRRQAYLERHQPRYEAEAVGEDDGGCAWDDAAHRRPRREPRAWDSAGALAGQGDGVDIDFRAAPGTEAPAKAPAAEARARPQKQQQGQQRGQQPEQEQKAEGPKVVTSRAWNSLFAGKSKSEPAAPLFAKQVAEQGGFSFLGGASAFPETLPSNIFTRDGFDGGRRNQQEQQQAPEHGGRAGAVEGEAQGEPAAEKKNKKVNKSAGLKGESLFANLDQQFVFSMRCATARFSRFFHVGVCWGWGWVVVRTLYGCNSFVRPDEKKVREQWAKTREIVGKDTRNKARTQRRRHNLMTNPGSSAAAIERTMQENDLASAASSLND